MKKLLIKFVKIAEKLNVVIGVAAAQLVILLTFIVVYEVIRRKIFNSPTSWAFEFSTFLYGGMFILGAGFTHLYDRHVAIDVFEEKLPPKVRCWLRIITFFIFFLPFVSALLFASTQYALHSWITHEHSWSAWKPPIYIYKTVMPVGFFLLFIEGVAKLIKDIFELKGEKI
jgi:TRAP-type mannitol/chloroaromatic compound transport system permease small subunit